MAGFGMQLRKDVGHKVARKLRCISPEEEPAEPQSKANLTSEGVNTSTIYPASATSAHPTS